MYIRRITRTWNTSSGEEKSKTYYYWYKSHRIGKRVISECIGPASIVEYNEAKAKNAIKSST